MSPFALLGMEKISGTGDEKEGRREKENQRWRMGEDVCRRSVQAQQAIAVMENTGTKYRS